MREWMDAIQTAIGNSFQSDSRATVSQSPQDKLQPRQSFGSSKSQDALTANPSDTLKKLHDIPGRLMILLMR
jgi:hypothetical protein